MYQSIEECRICGSKKLTKYFHLGMMPLANSYVDPKSKDNEFGFPLEVLFCENCSLSQLSIVVDPVVMFSNYAYHSSISKTFQKHCADMAEQVKGYLKKPNLFVVDIASNDGCMLREYKKKGFRVLGVEPAKNLAEMANAEGIETLPYFWDEVVAKKILQKYGAPDVITATNVFAHVHDVKSFVQNVKLILADEGVFIIECPYALNLIKKNEFDTIYHEHLSYFLVKPLLHLFEQEGMELADVQEMPIHGGTIRVFVTKKENKGLANQKARIADFLEREQKEGLHSIQSYFNFVNQLLDLKIDLLQLLSKIKKEHKSIAAYGASAKGNTMLNYCGVSSDFIDFIIDETPEKQNKLYPGNHIPIFGYAELEKRKPDYLVILAWNFAKEIMDKTKEHEKRGGKYIVPIPKVRVISGVNDL
ncbi:MAG: class I SAM-dependent methyltransferase [Candidatus Micrarchaeota archaeon]